MKLHTFFLITILPFIYSAQEDNKMADPLYTRKYFVNVYDSSKFKNSINSTDGLVRRYYLQEFDFFDISDDGKHLMKINQPVLVCSEGNFVAGKKSGMFQFLLIDSTQPSKKYKSWEINYFKDKMNGEVKAYTLSGTIAATFQYKDDSIIGKHVIYDPTGKFKVEEIEYKKGITDYIKRNYSDSTGQLLSEEIYTNNLLNGKRKTFYPNGKIEYEEFYVDDKINGTARYYYPSGRLNMELEFRNDKFWTIIGSYNPDGTKRNGGDLKEGNGTIIRYDENGVGYPYIYIKGMPISQ